MAYGIFIISGLAVGILYALGGVGLIVLYRATGVLNFAYGAIGALGVMAAWQLLQWGYPEWLSWLCCLAIATVSSVGYGRFVGPRLAHREPIVKAVATLGFALCILGLMEIIWIDNPRKLALVLDSISFNVAGLRVNGTRLLALGCGLLLTFGTGFVLARTRVGLMMRAIAVNRDVAAVLGTPIRKVETLAWGVSGFFAGITGMLFGSLVRLDPTVLTFLVIPIIATTVVGRLNSIPVTFLAGLFMGACESLIILAPPLAPFRSATPFVIAIMALLFLQRG
jgi:branched-chain amino acid transport system permease protein